MPKYTPPTDHEIEAVMRDRINAGQEIPAEYAHLRTFGFNAGQSRDSQGRWSAANHQQAANHHYAEKVKAEAGGNRTEAALHGATRAAHESAREVKAGTSPNAKMGQKLLRKAISHLHTLSNQAASAGNTPKAHLLQTAAGHFQGLHDALDEAHKTGKGVPQINHFDSSKAPQGEFKANPAAAQAAGKYEAAKTAAAATHNETKESVLHRATAHATEAVAHLKAGNITEAKLSHRRLRRAITEMTGVAQSAKQAGNHAEAAKHEAARAHYAAISSQLYQAEAGGKPPVVKHFK